MLMRRPARAARTVSVRVYGVVFLALLALLVGLAVASYKQVFTPVVRVTLLTDHVGNQLSPPADVKLRGLIVGQVRSVTADGSRARVELALAPDTVGLIPRNVRARLLPKTLFGERFVSLVLPEHPAAAHIAAGDVIPQDRSQTAIELEKVFEDTLPLLRTLKPEQLSYTLNALATALDGRGDKLGDNLVRVDRYLKQINPKMPTIAADISGLADVAGTYGDAAPDLVRLLRNATVTSKTLVDERSRLADLFAATAGAADTGRAVLSENADRIIQLGSTSRPTLELLAHYSPEYPCLLAGLTRWQPRIDKAFSGGIFHITLEVAPQRPAYQPGEEPRWEETRGPSCQGLPDPVVPNQGDKLRDGTAPGRTPRGSTAPAADATSGLAGTLEERQVVSSILSPVMGLPADQVPDVAALLFGPMARGTVVGLS